MGAVSTVLASAEGKSLESFLANYTVHVPHVTGTPQDTRFMASTWIAMLSLQRKSCGHICTPVYHLDAYKMHKRQPFRNLTRIRSASASS